MIVYEVNLSIDTAIFQAYKDWLEAHIDEMLRFPGFIRATLLHPALDDKLPATSAQQQLSVQYTLENAEDLQSYLRDHAPKMRGDGIARFGNRFTATRRIFEVKKVLNATEISD